MKLRLLLPLAGALATGSLSAGTIDFNGNVHATDGTGFPWVLGSTMWGAIGSGSFAGTGHAGFTSLAAINPALLTFSFGDLELTDHLSPDAVTGGFEYYSEGDASVQPFEVRYNGILWATGTSVFLRTEVDDSSDANAIGTGRAVLTAAGADAAFFNEVMAQTGGSGQLDITITGFFPVNNEGDFSSLGTISTAAPVPEPAASAGLAALAVLGFAFAWRRRGRARER